MTIARGHDRIVIVLYFIVIKLPNVQNAYASRDRRPLWRGIIRKIHKNWQEFAFYVRTRHQFCVPTYFSLFGLVNIQPRLAPVPEDVAIRHLWPTLFSVTEQRFNELGFTGHTLQHPRNFGLWRGRVVLCDYTKERDQSFILQYGEAFQREFGQYLPE
jgi:hypothetical protein